MYFDQSNRVSRVYGTSEKTNFNNEVMMNFFYQNLFCTLPSLELENIEDLRLRAVYVLLPNLNKIRTGPESKKCDDCEISLTCERCRINLQNDIGSSLIVQDIVGMQSFIKLLRTSPNDIQHAFYEVFQHMLKSSYTTLFTQRFELLNTLIYSIALVQESNKIKLDNNLVRSFLKDHIIHATKPSLYCFTKNDSYFSKTLYDIIVKSTLLFATVQNVEVLKKTVMSVFKNALKIQSDIVGHNNKNSLLPSIEYLMHTKTKLFNKNNSLDINSEKLDYVVDTVLKIYKTDFGKRYKNFLSSKTKESVPSLKKFSVNQLMVLSNLSNDAIAVLESIHILASINYFDFYYPKNGCNCYFDVKESNEHLLGLFSEKKIDFLLDCNIDELTMLNKFNFLYEVNDLLLAVILSAQVFKNTSLIEDIKTLINSIKFSSEPKQINTSHPIKNLTEDKIIILLLLLKLKKGNFISVSTDWQTECKIPEYLNKFIKPDDKINFSFKSFLEEKFLKYFEGNGILCKSYKLVDVK